MVFAIRVSSVFALCGSSCRVVMWLVFAILVESSCVIKKYARTVFALGISFGLMLGGIVPFIAHHPSDQHGSVVLCFTLHCTAPGAGVQV